MTVPTLQAAVNGRAGNKQEPAQRPARAEEKKPPASAGEASRSGQNAPDAPPPDQMTEKQIEARIRELEAQREAAHEEARRIREELEPKIREMQKQIAFAGQHAAATQRRTCREAGRLADMLKHMRQRKGKG